MAIIGVDVSKYEVQIIKDDYGKVTSIVDWWRPERSKKPIDFVIQRVSYGGKPDEYLDLMYSECVKIPIRGAYHYYNSGVTWQTQLERILKSIEGKVYHFLAVDYEEAYNNLNGTTFAEMTELVTQLKKVTNQRVLMYFSPKIYNKYMRPNNANAIINQQDIWLAHYPWTLFLNLDKPPALPSGITKTPEFWQFGGSDVANTAGYTAGYDYGSWRHGIDLVKWKGTLPELHEWAKVSVITPDPIPLPSVDVKPIELIVLNNNGTYVREIL